MFSFFPETQDRLGLRGEPTLPKITHKKEKPLSDPGVKFSNKKSFSSRASKCLSFLNVFKKKKEATAVHLISKKSLEKRAFQLPQGCQFNRPFKAVSTDDAIVKGGFKRISENGNKGGYGEVNIYKTIDGKSVAIKQFYEKEFSLKKRAEEAEQLNQMFQSLETSKGNRKGDVVGMATNHNNIVKTKGVLVEVKEGEDNKNNTSHGHSDHEKQYIYVDDPYKVPFERAKCRVKAIVYEALDGMTLDEAFNRGAIKRSPELALAVLRDLAPAIAHLRQRNILHGDIKPENIMIVKTEKGFKFVLMDFGFAEVLKNDKSYSICGTPEYMPPEKIKAYQEEIEARDEERESADMIHSYGAEDCAIGTTLMNLATDDYFPANSEVGGELPDNITIDEMHNRSLEFYSKTKDEKYKQLCKLNPELEKFPELTDAIAALMEEDPEKRITSEDALKKVSELPVTDLKDLVSNPASRVEQEQSSDPEVRQGYPTPYPVSGPPPPPPPPGYGRRPPPPPRPPAGKTLPRQVEVIETTHF